MNTNEIAVHEMKRHRISVIVDLLTESVCQPSKPTHVHPHCEILALHVTRRYVLGVGDTRNNFQLAADALGRTVAFFGFF